MRRALLVLGTCAVSLAVSTVALAQRPVIPPGREAEVQALLLPHRLGEEVAGGWSLDGISIEMSTIRLELVDATGARAGMQLDHPGHAPEGAIPCGSFAVTMTSVPPGSADALESLRAAVERAENHDFWQSHQVLAMEREIGSAAPWSARSNRAALGIVSDGLFLFAVFVVVLFALVGRTLQGFGAHPGASREVRVGLLAVVGLGVLLRLTLSPEVGLDAWSHSRFFTPARLVWEGPLLGWLTDEPVWATSTITTTVLVLSFFAPLTIFVHARYLLADHRAALIAAALIAILPMHLRFSHSDVAFIGSMTISSLAFAMIHAATRERSWGWAAVGLPLAAAPIAMTYAVRPDNMVYFPLLLATAFVDEGVWADKPSPSRGRIALVAAWVCAVTFGFGLPNLLANHGEQVHEGLGLRTLLSALQVAVSPTHNALLNPEFSPPALTALAIFGAWDLIRRRRRRLAAFLVGWLTLFLITHAYVVPREPYMQARYHLHLVIPYVLLATCGIEGALRRIADHRHRRWMVGAAAVVLAASPLLHLHFIRNVELNEPREWLWVNGLRDIVPEGCTVLEYTGERAGARFERLGAYTEHGEARARWNVVEIPLAAPGDPELPESVRRLLESPPECLYWYEGVPCWGQKPPGFDGQLAPACHAVPGYVALDEVARLELRSRPYDHNLAFGLEDGQRIVLKLQRATPRDRVQSPAGAR